MCLLSGENEAKKRLLRRASAVWFCVQIPRVAVFHFRRDPGDGLVMSFVAGIVPDVRRRLRVGLAGAVRAGRPISAVLS